MYRLKLASQSPRRKQLLSEAGYQLQVVSVKVSEYIEKNVNIREEIVNCAFRKGEAYVEANKHLESQKILVLSADTMVVMEGELLGKPETQQAAKQMLEKLSGKTHSVITGGVLFDLYANQVHRFSDSTDVVFKSLTEKQIINYVNTGEPMDKAGSYGIQGRAKEFVESIKGSWSNVVGFPIEKFEKLVKENGWNIQRR